MLFHFLTVRSFLNYNYWLAPKKDLYMKYMVRVYFR